VPYIDWKMFIYFMYICNILRTLGILHDHLVNFVFIWYILSGFGIMYQEKSGNPGAQEAKTGLKQKLWKRRSSTRFAGFVVPWHGGGVWWYRLRFGACG
jgi:hypothetical protein